MRRFLDRVRIHHLLLLCGGYALLYLIGFWRTPFGMHPVLDGEENLIAARQIAAGQLPVEPFYRAMLYPAVLALLMKGGVPPDKLPVAAGLLGLACHLLSTYFVYRSARALWGETGKTERAALAAAALFGLNPVAVYFAGEVMDGTFALALALGGVAAALLARDTRSGSKSVTYAEAAGLAWGLASAARPHFLTLLVAGPLLLAWTADVRRRQVGTACAVAGLTVLLGGGLVQLGHSGRFELTPWQGAYNLWAANKPGANGKYFAQEIVFAGQAEHRNPTRMESELLYARETGLAPPDVDAMNRHWRTKFLARLRAEPAVWVGLMLRKLYYLLNTYEQYNNKTFAFQRTLSPWLGWNPLHWGLALVLGAAGGSVLWRRTGRRRALALVAGLAVAYAAGTLLYYASDRFRFPLLPIVCLLAGGAVLVGEARSWSREARVVALLAVAGAALVTYTPFFGSRDASTIVMDRVLLADAALKVGDDRQAARLSWELRGDERVRGQAVAIFLASYANLRLERDVAATIAAYGDWAAQESLWARLPELDQNLEFLRAVQLWNTGRRAEASRSWRAIASNPHHARAANALACLLLSGAWQPEDEPLLNGLLQGNPGNVGPVLYSVLTRLISPERVTSAQAELVRMYQRLLGVPET
jgi:hypothetical protein